MIGLNPLGMLLIVSCDSGVFAAVLHVYRIFEKIRIIGWRKILALEALVDRLLVLLNYGQAVRDLVEGR